MQVTFDSVSDLAQALRRAEAAHGQHEAQIGHPDPDWPTWYAHYMFDEQTEHLGRAMQGEQAVRQDQAQQAGAEDTALGPTAPPRDTLPRGVSG